ncbi:SPFH domain-containing protein [Methanococcus aeolicus]|uniref:SPFH domain-containing protein n=1 Tax=Methanococcus aeolicus TaxID=42879 RepID=UPI001E578755|nr:prohibitin family protein [Methanococcus aeolicus]UXM84050.1 prohibitin family protein [Methanococcus aeolicus]
MANYRIIIILGVVLMGASLFSSYYIIDSTEVGIVKTFGKVNPEPVESGIHFKIPIVQDVVRMNIYEKNMDMVENNGNAVKVLTREGLPVVIDLSVQYKINPKYAPELYLSVKNPEPWMTSRIRAKVRDIISEYSTDELYGEKRTEVQQKINTEIDKEFNDKGIIVTAVLIRNIDLPQQVEQAIERKMKSKQEAEQMKYEVQRAKTEAEKKIVEAQGQANATRILAKAIRENPEILEYKKLDALKEMASNDNKVFIVPSSNDLILNVDNK